MATTAGAVQVPDHVPAENVWDNDFYAYLGELDDPYKAAGRLHDGPGIIWATNGSHGLPSWIFTRHRLIQEGFGNARKFSSRRGPLTEAVVDPAWMMIPVEADPPNHQYYRNVLRPFFTPEAIAGQTAEIQALTDSLIDGFVERGHCEFVSEFAQIFPNAIVVQALGLPQESLRQFLDWEEKAIHGKDAADRALTDFEARFRRDEIPADMPEVRLQADGEGLPIAAVLKQAGLTPSTSDALRMLAQGGVKLDGEKVSDKSLKLAAGTTAVLQVGKRKFARVTVG